MMPFYGFRPAASRCARGRSQKRRRTRHRNCEPSPCSSERSEGEGPAMRSAILDEHEPKTHLLVFDPGEEVMKGLLAFVKREGLAAGHLTAIGAVSDAVLGFFDRQAKDYRRIPQQGQAEVLSMIGDVALKEDGQPGVHVHAVLGLPDGSTRGGHLIEARVWPTLEVVLTESPRHLRRTFRPDLGLALIDLK